MSAVKLIPRLICWVMDHKVPMYWHPVWGATPLTSFCVRCGAEAKLGSER